MENRNTIEMQSIVALAHINALVLFFIDLSESCGYTIAEQIKLYESLTPILKDVLIVFSKSDLTKRDAELDLLETFLIDKRHINISVKDDLQVEMLKEMIYNFYKKMSQS